MRLPVRPLSRDTAILAGAQPGKRLFAHFVACSQGGSQPDIVFLDFDGVEFATASYLRESVVAFRDYARATLPNLYPVVANEYDAVREELDFFLRQRKDAMWSCALDEHDAVSAEELLGELDQAHRETFDAVRALGGASAPELARSNGTAVKATAWNNRLSQLAGRGLLVERKAGKTKTFIPVLENI